MHRSQRSKVSIYCIDSRGFTLLELLVVMVIIGLLAGYVGPRYFAQIGKSEVKTARAQIDALKRRWTSTGWISGAIRPASRD